MGLAHVFLFLYKYNPMCSIYIRYLPYSFFSFNRINKGNIGVVEDFNKI